MKKILVIGCPGSGKSYFSKLLHQKTNIPLYHLDNIWHNEDKTNIGDVEFYKRLDEILNQDSFIMDGMYYSSLKYRIEYVDTIFFLDYPLDLCLKSIKERVGIKRDDMPWIEEELDKEFEEYVKRFPIKQLPIILDILNEYKNKKDIHIFKNRNEANEYLNLL